MQRIIIALAVFILMALPAEAAPTLAAAKAQLRNLKRSETSFARTVTRLTPANRTALKNSLGKTGKDSDADGISDTYEKARGSNVCDDDSDNDGINDDDDPYEKDGNKTGEVETKGTITSFTDPTLVVGSTTFTVTSQTVFRRPLTSKEDLTEGLCVEVEGYVDSSSANVATKIKREDSCGGGDGGEDD